MSSTACWIWSGIDWDPNLIIFPKAIIACCLIRSALGLSGGNVAAFIIIGKIWFEYGRISSSTAKIKDEIASMLI